MLKHMRKTTTDFGKSVDHGYSLVELLVVLFIIITFAAIAIPNLMTMVGNLKTRGDARDLNGEIVLAKMRAASDYARARVYADLSAKTFHIDVYQSGGSGWVADGGTQSLSNSVTFGYGSLTSPPAGMTSLSQAPLCLQDNLTSTVANTACIMFNSRGIPVDSTLTPTGSDALYVTDGKSITGVTVSVTGLTKIWRSDVSTANWNQY
jgi:Tfp pilus assembly protein FimT